MNETNIIVSNMFAIGDRLMMYPRKPSPKPEKITAIASNTTGTAKANLLRFGKNASARQATVAKVEKTSDQSNGLVL